MNSKAAGIKRKEKVEIENKNLYHKEINTKYIVLKKR
jgi:hypothetical protein